MSHQYQARTGPLVNDPSPFSFEMVAGNRPDRPRLPFNAKVGWQSSQTTFDVQMTVEMFAGVGPTTPRIFLAPRLPLPISQTTHVSAPFSAEMVAGNRPDQPRPAFRPHYGWTDSQLTFIVQMTPEMWSGWLPSSPRLFLGPRIPLPLAQTTHVSAPFGVEMVTGNHPDKPRIFIYPKLGWQDSQITPILIMTPEMFAGNMPHKPRIFLGPRIPLPLSQAPTPVAAPFTQSMVEGNKPFSPRIFIYPKLGTFTIDPSPLQFKLILLAAYTRFLNGIRSTREPE